jgi:hypothetical protein
MSVRNDDSVWTRRAWSALVITSPFFTLIAVASELR